MSAAILEITSVGQSQGQQMLNRWHFLDITGVADPAPVLPAFVTDVLGPYAMAAVTSVSWGELLWRILTDPLTPQQSYEISPAIVGTDGGAPMPSYVAITCKWGIGPTTIISAESPQRRVRRGGKRFGGLEDGGAVGNVVTSGEKTKYELIAEGYLGMSVGGFVPVVCGFPQRPPKGTDADNPLLTVPNKYANITGFTVRNNLGSQVSRKVGHGR